MFFVVLCCVSSIKKCYFWGGKQQLLLVMVRKQGVLSMCKCLLVLFLGLFSLSVWSHNIQRFEYYSSENGLSQNTVYSILCDKNGFLWLGTMNGLNRYDGETFKVYKGVSEDGHLSNSSRIERIWEDAADFIWMETYDGAYQYFNQRTESFGSLPLQSDNVVDAATCFTQYNSNIVVVGSERSGLYLLYLQDVQNGYKIENFNPIVEGEIATIYNVYVDEFKGLWVLTDKGVAYLNEKQIVGKDFTPAVYCTKTSFTGSVVEIGKELYLGTAGEGMLVCNLDDMKFDYHKDERLNKVDVEQLLLLSDSTLAVTTNKARAYILNLVHDKVVELKYHDSGVSDVDNLYLDKYFQLWISTRNPGLTRHNLKTGKSQYYTLIPEHMSASVDLERPFFCEDSNNNLWIGLHGGGLAWYNRIDDNFTFYRNSVNAINSVPSNIVHCIAEDPSGSLWLGTGQYRGGLVKVIAENRAFRNTIPDSETVSQIDNVVRALYEDPAHNLWVATKGGVLTIYDEHGREIRSMEGLTCVDGTVKQSIVYDIEIDREGYLWIATKGAGVFVSSKKIDFLGIRNEQLLFHNYNRYGQRISKDASERLGNDNCYSLAEDAFGNMWVATFGNGLSRIKRNANGVHITIFNKECSDILSDKVRYLHIDKLGSLWVATTNGVCKADASSLNNDEMSFEPFVHTSEKNSLSYNDVCHIYSDSKGKYYFATIGGGLNVMTFENGEPQFRVYTTHDGLCNNAVYSITEDNGGDLWLTTDNGISRCDLKKNVIESFSGNTGLVFNSFSESTAIKLSNGRLVFGGYMGFVTVSPLQLASTPHKANLVLTSLHVANKEVMVSSSNEIIDENINYVECIKLRSDQSNFSISYRSLDNMAPDNIRYAYMLEGIDEDWNYVGKQTKAIYTNIQAGTYTFKVKCTYRNGEWRDIGREVEVVVVAPWWKSSYAIAVYIILLIAAIFFVTNIFMRINHYRHELIVEKKVNEIKLQFFTNIAHEIRTPLTLIVSPIETLLHSGLAENVMSQLMIIKRNSNRILMLVNQLLDFRKIQNKKMYLKVAEVDMGNLVSQVADSFKLLADHKRMDYRVIVQEGMKPIWVDTAEMDTVIYNLVSNALKFTDVGKRVTISVKQDDAYTYVEVADEGCGLKSVDPEVLFKRYTILSTNELSGTGIGLSLAYELVQMHGGDILVKSESGVGTTFTVKLRNTRSHFENDPMVTFGEVTSQERYAVLQDIDMVYEEEKNENDKSKKTVLIVEDNPEILSYVSQSLMSNFNCLRASNGEEALVVVKEQMPDIIVTDIMMPVMDGMEMIRSLKSDFSTSHIPIIALTAKGTTQDLIDTYKMGVDAYIVKPFSVEQLKVIVNNLLKKREMYVSQLVEGGKNVGVNQTTSEEVDFSAKGEDQEVNLNILSKDQEFIKGLVSFTEENYRSDLSIDQFADHFHMSRTVFYNKVKGLTGQSPLEFVRQIKFKIAEQLLQKGYNVSEVAFEIGYSDVKYFSKQFKSQFGYAPSQVKKSHHGANDESATEEEQAKER